MNQINTFSLYKICSFNLWENDKFIDITGPFIKKFQGNILPKYGIGWTVQKKIDHQL